MNNANFRLSLSFVTPDESYPEHTSDCDSIIDALDEADEIAFSHTGFPLENWLDHDFGSGNRLFLFYPNEDDKTSRFKLTITEATCDN